MTLQTIKKLLHGSRPFTLRMVSGRAIQIPHPDFVALAPSESYLVFAATDGDIELIRINQIESIKTHRKTATA